MAFLLFMYVVAFPFHLANTFFVEHRFGLSNQRLFSWLSDEAKSMALSFTLWIACMEVFYLVLRNFPGTWWLIAALLWVFFSIVLARFLPVLIIPLFYKYLPMEDGTLKKGILELADKANIRLMDVCGIDFSRKTKKANAALVGLGKTRKVILADTLTGNFTQEEVETVVAHEFAHFRYKHIWQLLALSGSLTIVGFYILFRVANKLVNLSGASGISDLYLFPALIFLMVVFGLALLPAQNLFSRILERQADRYAIGLTGNAPAFASTMRKLASMNLADAEPSLLKKVFMYDHPPIGERIRMAEGLKDKDAR
jgi:STE24 endopeptidase